MNVARVNVGIQTKPKKLDWLKVGVGVFGIAWGCNSFTPLMHMYTANLHWTSVVTDSMLVFYVLGIAPALFICSALSDMHGRKKIFIAGTIICFLSSALICLGTVWDNAIIVSFGRFFIGFSLGIAMAVGGSWIKELVNKPESNLGAILQSLMITGGFAFGALAGGYIADYLPEPRILPYVIDCALMLLGIILAPLAPETLFEFPQHRKSIWANFKVPSAKHKVFVRIIAPCTIWVLFAASTSYVIVPGLVNGTQKHPLAFAGLIAVVGLSVGLILQIFIAPKISNTTGLLLGMFGVFIGFTVTIFVHKTDNMVLTFLASMLCGGAFGLLLVSGLSMVQKIAPKDELAGLSALYYSLCYSGFAAPLIISILQKWVSFESIFIFLSICALITLAYVNYWKNRVTF